ncbi:hypothetical protein TSMEX_010986 [Taenia solium]|eukprot:TsM_001221000 transcript=TsM_001221000 gene=TsM_001221000
MERYRLGTESRISDEVVRGGENFHYTEGIFAPGWQNLQHGAYSGTLSVAASLLGRKMSDGTLISRSVSISNGEPHVDVWTVALYARRARPRLRSQSSGFVPLVEA